MKGCIELTPDELAQIVEATLKQSGYDVTGLALYDGDGLANFTKAVVEYNVPPIKVRIAPDTDKRAEQMKLMRSMLYPDLNDVRKDEQRPASD